MTSTTLPNLAERLAALETALAGLQRTLEADCLIRLRADRDDAFLGQPVRLRAEVTGRLDGRPRAGVPVTFVAAWGHLDATDGSRRRGTSLTRTTLPDGVVEVVLHPPLRQRLGPAEDAALQGALARLDGIAPRPDPAGATFGALVRDYQWDVNKALRQAVDAFFAEFVANEAGGKPDGALGGLWPTWETSVTAYARNGDDPNGPAHGASVWHFAFKDWLRPWLTRYQRELEADSRYEAELSRLRQAGADLSLRFAGIATATRIFVQRQAGLAGRFVGNQASARVLHRLADLDEDIDPEFRNGLHGAAEAVAVGGPAVFEGLGQIGRSGNDQLTRAVDRLETALADKADAAALSQVDARVGDLDRSLAGKAEQAQFAHFQRQIGDRLKTVDTRLEAKVDLTEFRELETRVDGRFDGIGRDLGKRVLEERFLEAGAETAQKLESLSTAIKKKADKGKMTQLAAKVSEVREQVETKADVASHQALRRLIGENLNQLQRRVSGYDVIDGDRLLIDITPIPIGPTPIVPPGDARPGEGGAPEVDRPDAPTDEDDDRDPTG
ncbi:hypothetical protein SCOR_07635 [Sulfidibacter corallicola]|uniref:Uncharacterized protein n=1 Tax=Sulfidibacter corallicola TaxID=2818388 RepID=A0A8A4TXV5_SULCO|nr:hypothetical protein [Sulfidibacter corallicola]QTD51365.1 hypothetical protein J3U87_02755 [Sulfidibacter corallicola]